MNPIEDPLNYKLGIFYFNKEDHRILVPKMHKWMGWTFNFAHFQSYLLLLGLILVITITAFICK